MCTVASADGYLIAGLNTCTFKYYVKLCYLTGNTLVLKFFIILCSIKSMNPCCCSITFLHIYFKTAQN